MDVLSPEQRLRAMRANRGRTNPERKLASALWRLGYRYVTSDGFRRRYHRRLIGNPDIIFVGMKVAIFVDGCFWHGCNRCHDFEKNCNQWWLEKISTTRERDSATRRSLRRLGWRVWRIWEHDVRRPERFANCVQRFHNRLSRLRTDK